MKLRLKSRLKHSWLPLFVIAGITTLLLFRLGSLTNGLAQTETQLPSVQQATDNLWNEPLLLPFSLVQLFVALVLPGDGYTASRLPAALLGGLTAAFLFWVLRQWYGLRLALFGTMLLATAPWFLHVSRLATPAIVYPFAITLILVLAVLWHRKERSRTLLYLSGLVGAVLLSVPGMVWLLVCLLVVERKNILESVHTHKLHAALAALLALIVLVPLGRFLLDTAGSHYYLLLLGYGGNWDSVLAYGKEYLSSWIHIFVGGYRQPVYNLVSLPLVNIFMTLSFAVGAYLYSKHPKAQRTRLLLLLWLVGTAVIALPNNVSLALLLPVVIILVTGGIGYLLHLWLKVFPRNPLARGFGIGLIALVVLFAVAYNMRSYFVAWPNNPDTRQAFSRKL